MRAALKPGAPQVWPEQRRQRRLDAAQGDAGDQGDRFAKADRDRPVDDRQQPPRHNYMETRGCIGEYDAKTKTLDADVRARAAMALRDTLAGIPEGEA